MLIACIPLHMYAIIARSRSCFCYSRQSNPAAQMTRRHEGTLIIPPTEVEQSLLVVSGCVLLPETTDAELVYPSNQIQKVLGRLA